jgi:hypothetical protein
MKKARPKRCEAYSGQEQAGVQFHTVKSKAGTGVTTGASRD